MLTCDADALSALDTTSPSSVPLASLPLDDCLDLSTKIIRHVMCVEEPLVLPDATATETFGRDPVVRRRSLRSVLCVPLRRQAAVVGASAVIARQTLHMTALVDDLLDVSRVTRGLVKLVETVELGVWQTASLAIEQVRLLIEARRHALTLQSAPHAAVVRADPKRLVQVLTNLLSNAPSTRRKADASRSRWACATTRSASA